jgi:hypothetical protein
VCNCSGQSKFMDVEWEYKYEVVMCCTKLESVQL